VAAKRSSDPRVDSLRDHLKLGGVHGASRVELDALLCSAREHAVKKSHVQVKIQIEAPAESLKERYGSPFAALQAFALGARAVADEYGIGEDPYDGTQHVLLEGRESAHLVGKREHDPCSPERSRRHAPQGARAGRERAGAGDPSASDSFLTSTGRMTVATFSERWSSRGRSLSQETGARRLLRPGHKSLRCEQPGVRAHPPLKDAVATPIARPVSLPIIGPVLLHLARPWKSWKRTS